jgi:hypothetical protein
MRQLTTPAGTTADDDWQVPAFLDHFDAYRTPSTAFDAYGGATTSAPTKVINNAVCSLHATPNYDVPVGHVGQVKQNNILTSDKMHVAITTDIWDGDTVKITDRNGDVAWAQVMGAPKKRIVLGFMLVYLNTIPKPTWAT